MYMCIYIYIYIHKICIYFKYTYDYCVVPPIGHPELLTYIRGPKQDLPISKGSAENKDEVPGASNNKPRTKRKPIMANSPVYFDVSCPSLGNEQIHV